MQVKTPGAAESWNSEFNRRKQGIAGENDISEALKKRWGYTAEIPV